MSLKTVELVNYLLRFVGAFRESDNGEAPIGSITAPTCKDNLVDPIFPQSSFFSDAYY